MSFNWSEFGEIAKVIENLPNDSKVSREAKIRNAVSRMSYHAFHCLINWATKDLKYTFEEGHKTHEHLIRFLYKTHHDDKGLHYTLLRKFRTIADYKEEVEDLELLLNETKKHYKLIVEPLAKYSQKE